MRLSHLFCIGVAAFGSWAQAEDIQVAVASNFTAVMKSIVADFEKQSGHHVRLSFASSGKIYAQVQHGAPYDVFFSADQAKPAALIEKGLAIAESHMTYAIGTLALWSSDPELLDDQASALTSLSFRKLALANPKLAPYGQAAVDTLNALNLKNASMAKWVLGENIAQTYQFVRSGNADMGFVALSQIMEQGQVKSGSFWQVPESMYRPIRQDAVLLKHGEHSDAAQALLRYMRSPQAESVILSYGYRLPEA